MVKDCLLSSQLHPVPLLPAHTSLTHRKYFPPMKSNLSLEDASWSPIEHSYTRQELIRMGNEHAGLAMPCHDLR